MTARPELTLRRIRLRPNLENTDFERSYEALLLARTLSDPEYVFLLSRAILFLRADDDLLNRLGYRILLQYAAVTGDFLPLYEVAIAKDYIPVAAAIERLGLARRSEASFASVLWEAHLENFSVPTGGVWTYRTRGQMELRAFAAGESLRSVVIAPTSYGKSEMMIERVRVSIGQHICIVVPSKALIAQTKRMLLQDRTIRGSHTKIVTHPDSVVDLSQPFIAVLTQERLSRLLRRQPDLSIGVVLVDEAHNALPEDDRAEHLVQTLMAVQFRNPNVHLTYFTPFVVEAKSLAAVNDEGELQSKSIGEYVKIERLHFADLAAGRLFLYDQFLNRTIELPDPIESDQLAVVERLAGAKTIMYLNRPRDAEKAATDLAARLPRRESTDIETVIAAISDLIHPQYGLIDCLRSGVVFHHGRVPEVLRQYIEQLFSDPSPSAPRYLATTSTLLEGVNTPADVMFILSPSKGRGYLTRAAFKNLVGRVGRFKEIFDPERGDLRLLQPEIYVLDGEFTRNNFSPLAFMRKVADVLKLEEDKVENPLLVESSSVDRRGQLLEYLENVEPGASGLEDARTAQTQIGLLCFQNNVLDFDILDCEATVNANFERELAGQAPISSPNRLIEAVVGVFFRNVELDDADELERVRDNPSAQAFYAMFVDWRSQATPMRLMINQFLRYWRGLSDELVYVGSAWGELPYGSEGGRLLYVRMRNKSEQQRVNLAVAKIKEEQDFVDYKLMKYVEVLKELEAIEESFYNRLKYGTDEPGLIALLKLGLSMELARLLRNNYWESVAFEAEAESIALSPELLELLSTAGENEILLYELECHVPAVDDSPHSSPS